MIELCKICFYRQALLIYIYIILICIHILYFILSNMKNPKIMNKMTRSLYFFH